MKVCALVPLVLASLKASCDGFTVGPLAGVTVKTGGAAASTTALFDSRRRQKIASRTAWLEARGMATAEAAKAEGGTAAAPGLMKNEHGLEYVRLVNPDTGASSEIYLFGGVVTSYVDGDGTDFIAVRPDAVMDGSKPISGGLSHCFPQFGPSGLEPPVRAGQVDGLALRNLVSVL